jgi:hypothetical protein
MTPDDAKALRAPFPASAIGKLPKGGAQLDYVGHAATTDRILTVDYEWTWEPMALTPEGLPALDREGNLWIRLTVGGVTRLGVGDGPNMKVRIGDAIRNAAMRFGVALDLWAKEDLHDIAAGVETPKMADVAAHDTDTVSNAREAAFVFKQIKEGDGSVKAAARRAAIAYSGEATRLTEMALRAPELRRRVAQAIAAESRDDGAHPSPSDELAALFPGDAS